MPNPYSLANLGNFSYPGPGKTPAQGQGIPFKDGFRPPMPGEPGGESPMPQLPGAPANPFVRPQADARPVPAWLPEPPAPEPEGQMFRSGFDATKMIPGKMEFGPQGVGDVSGPLAGLQQASFPELERIKLASQMRQQGLATGQGFGRPSIDIADAMDADVRRDLAPQAQQVGQIQQAITAQHPAISGLAERSALQKAYPQQAEAYGRIKSADIGADADVQKQILASQATNLESLRRTQPAAFQAMSELMKLMAIEDLDPQARAQQEAWRQMILGTLQRPFNRGGL